jgi:hypothetical protein
MNGPCAVISDHFATSMPNPGASVGFIVVSVNNEWVPSP